MRYGIISDIHSNREAFQSVIDALKKDSIDALIFAGDLVGYGADPKACIALSRQLKEQYPWISVGGNHDYAVCGLRSYDNYVYYAKEAINWTQKVLGEKEMEELRLLQLVERSENFTVVHANLEAPDSWGYIFDIDDADPNFKLLEDQICFVGHSHKPIVFESGDSVNWYIKDRVQIKDGSQYIINIGSVGQPRDGNPKASYGIYDSAKKEVSIKRVSYDIASAQDKILKAGLPRILADRLSMGK